MSGCAHPDMRLLVPLLLPGRLRLISAGTASLWARGAPALMHHNSCLLLPWLSTPIHSPMFCQILLELI